MTDLSFYGLWAAVILAIIGVLRFEALQMLWREFLRLFARSAPPGPCLTRKHPRRLISNKHIALPSIAAADALKKTMRCVPRPAKLSKRAWP